VAGRPLDSPREILRQRGLRPKRSWGQNFLADPAALAEIAAAARLVPGETVVELGPGLGHLTSALLETGARVVAVERDRDMVAALSELPAERLTIVAANAAAVNFAELAGTSSVVVVGNLPYQLTSPILFQVLDQHRSVSRAVFTVQKEVAQRVAAPVGTRSGGILTVLLGLWFEAELLFVLPAALFHPPPQVDSAVLRLTALAQPRAQVEDAAHFRRVVKAAFAQRRKTLLNSLRSDPTLGDAARVRAALEASSIGPRTRAEALSIEDFARLSRALLNR
jgi:16S rRNA (adenine1518-N6/adenine1519-N6)-dimethyltransferase